MTGLSTNRKRSTIIAGGGLAGVSAAVQLAKRGFQVDLIEVRRRLGGRVGSFTDPDSGQQIDYCQHVAMQCCDAFREFVGELGQQQDWHVEKTLHFYSNNGRHLPVKALPLPAPLHLAGLLLRWPDLKLGQRVRIGRALLQLMRTRPTPELYQVRAIDWLRDQGQDEETIRVFWETILVSALGDQLDRVNLGSTHKVLVDGFAAKRNAYWLWIPKQPLSQLMNQQCIEHLEREQVKLHLQMLVAKLLWRAGRVDGVELNDGRRLTADSVVLAMPWHRVRALIENDEAAPDAVRGWAASLKDIESSPITGVHTWWDRAWLPSPHAILTRRLCQWVFPGPSSEAGQEQSNSDDDRVSDNATYYQVVISGSRMLPKGDSEKIRQLVADDLREVFPQARSAKLLRCKSVTDPNAVFSVKPGMEGLRPACDLFAEHGLWLAGDWTQTGWPATMEGAIRSGNQVAESLNDR